jgi:UDP-N-acetylmuramoyl-L-alanyl-D-glutamate--2,6-diaminopimelate ligase
LSALHQTFASPQAAAQWLRRHTRGTLCSDSRQIRKGDAFLAWPGAATDARSHVAAALAAGAAVCLVEAEGVDAFDLDPVRVATYTGLRKAAAPVAAAYFEAPSSQLALLAVTGTNGKTSTAWWLAQALSQLGQRCALVGTLGIGEPGAMVFNGLTTPDPVLLQQQLRRLVDEGFKACALEASSIGLAEHRLDASAVHTAIFTNFTQDHLDYHGSMDAYWHAKSALFDWPGLKAAVINVDDTHGAALADVLRQREALDLWTLSCEGKARLVAHDIQHGADGSTGAEVMRFEVVEAESSTSAQAAAPVVGHYNVLNLLGVIAALRSLGVPLAAAASACRELTAVPGRMESLAQPGKPLVVIDYAHTPDALDKVLGALKPLAQSRGGALCCVFGCGGDRDAAKRPLMAQAAARYADRLTLTSDNPRSEDPAAIFSDIAAGLPVASCAQQQADRALAIAQAIASATPQDVVLIAGKGHEDYQEVQGIKRPFSDRLQAEAALAVYSAAAHAAPQIEVQGAAT